MDRDAPAQVWVGKGVPSEWLQSVLQLPSLEGVDTARLRIPLLETETSVRVNRLINAVRSQRPHLMQMPRVVVPKDALELRCASDGSNAAACARARLLRERWIEHGSVRTCW
jgi:hypothetical protein